MALALKLDDGIRAGHRRPVHLDGTIRSDGAPIDIVIIDLSRSGFKASLDRPLKINTVVGVGSASLGRHEAVVLWRDGPVHGFRFASPIAQAVIDGAYPRETVSHVNFAGPWSYDPADHAGLLEPLTPLWSARARLVTLAAAGVTGWSLVIWAISAVF